MTQPTLDNLRDAIAKHVAEMQLQLGHVLPNEEYAFLVESYTSHINDLALKFIKGSIEHSDSPFFTIDFDREDHNESLDSIHYRYGKRWLKARRSNGQH